MDPICVVVFAIATQLPYLLVWLGKSTFVYDAFTTFSPWNVARLAALRAGSGVFSVFQDNIPTDVWPSYFFTGIIRQIAALIQSNTASAHAVVQAIHLALLVPAVALLFRSLSIPVRFGALGGLVYALSGINVSLSQHVFSSEALLYLVVSLWCIRDLLSNWQHRSNIQNVLWFAATSTVLVSLVRVHHEAMLYVIPLFAWTMVHLWITGRGQDPAAILNRVVTLTVMAAIVAACSVPMLLTAYEMSLVNKTLIHSYDGLGPYFRETRVFLLALVLPDFTGSATPYLPGPFEIGQKPTLAYLFAGTLTFPFLATVVFAWIRERRWRQTATLLVTLGAVLGFSLGGGNPVNRLLCTLFPFLVGVGHYYYGLHILYLIFAFAVAEGMKLMSRGRYLLPFIASTVVVCVVTEASVPDSSVVASWGLTGDTVSFATAISADLRWMWMTSAIAIGLVAWAYGVLRTRSRRSHIAVGALLLAATSCLIAVDLLRPVMGAHFVPNSYWISWLHDPIGGFTPSQSVVEYFDAQTRSEGRSARVLPLFIHDGGWQANSLLPLNVHLVNMPGDSGGNRYITAVLQQTPSNQLIHDLIDDYGVDYFWVARWRMDDWAAVLRESDAVDLVFSSPYGGDVYRTKDEYLQRPQANDGTVHLAWDNPGDTVERTATSHVWRFILPTDWSSQASRIQLPLMWHAAYQVSFGRDVDIPYGEDDKGRVTLESFEPSRSGSTDEIVVRYPTRLLAGLLQVSAWLYVLLIGTVVVCLLGAVRSKVAARNSRG